MERLSKEEIDDIITEMYLEAVQVAEANGIEFVPIQEYEVDIYKLVDRAIVVEERKRNKVTDHNMRVIEDQFLRTTGMDIGPRPTEKLPSIEEVSIALGYDTTRSGKGILDQIEETKVVELRRPNRIIHLIRTLFSRK